VKRRFVWQELQWVQERGIVVPVMLEANIKVPLGFNGWQHIDLTKGKGTDRKAFNGLTKAVGNLVARPRRQQRGYNTMASDSYTIKTSIRATGTLQDLTKKVRSIEGLLIDKDGPVQDLLDSLGEIHRTYDAVAKAIDLFLAPISKGGKINVTPYLSMERGQLVTLIDNNRGHCKRIMEYYGREGGIRDWLKGQYFPVSKLSKLDNIFGQLGTADGDLFEALSRVGDVMTEESSAIVGLLIAGQHPVARKRLLADRTKLRPLEQMLLKAKSELQQNLSALGFVPSVVKRGKAKSY
jgi:hypothetical protein